MQGRNSDRGNCTGYVHSEMRSGRSPDQPDWSGDHIKPFREPQNAVLSGSHCRGSGNMLLWSSCIFFPNIYCMYIMYTYNHVIM